MELKKKIERATKLLWAANDNAKCVEICYSGGKDSDVILELAKLSGVNFRAIYKNTTIDPSGTIKHCKENGVEILRPKKSFFKLIEERGFPTRRCRFCCSELKEYKILDAAVQGIRRCESVKRAEMYKEPIICRAYGGKNSHVNVILPILEWTDADVADFIDAYKIKCHPLYYTHGKFDVKKRLGCLGCPLQSDKGLADFRSHPNLVKAWIRAGSVWWDKPRESNIRSKDKFESVYDLFVHNLFFDSYENFSVAKSGVFGTLNCKEALERYFGVNL